MTNLDIVTFTHNQLAIGKYGNISGPNQGGGLSNLNSSDEKFWGFGKDHPCTIFLHNPSYDHPWMIPKK